MIAEQLLAGLVLLGFGAAFAWFGRRWWRLFGLKAASDGRPVTWFGSSRPFDVRVTGSSSRFAAIFVGLTAATMIVGGVGNIAVALVRLVLRILF